MKQILVSGKTKTIIKGDRLAKKKHPDYKVAYVTLVSYWIVLDLNTK